MPRSTSIAPSSDPPAWLVNQDLHGGNVLRAEREPWLVIDPKPLVGERELEASGLLRNADDVSRWLDALAELGLDRERAARLGRGAQPRVGMGRAARLVDRHVEERPTDPQRTMRRATKKPAVPWTCGSVCRNSGRPRVSELRPLVGEARVDLEPGRVDDGLRLVGVDRAHRVDDRPAGSHALGRCAEELELELRKRLGAPA